jgi:hypothetical protein
MYEREATRLTQARCCVHITTEFRCALESPNTNFNIKRVDTKND